MGPLTQQDPIGIAGGLNVYGFANGDPINFSDPFGLGPCENMDAYEMEECLKEQEELEDEDDGGDPSCLVMSGIAALNVFADIATLAGVGLMVKAGAFAYYGAGTAATLASDAAMNHLAPAAVRETAELAAQSIQRASATAYSTVRSSTFTNTMTLMADEEGSSVSGWDFVPIVASVRSIDRAIHCPR